jgi:hypothetical protein
MDIPVQDIQKIFLDTIPHFNQDSFVQASALACAKCIQYTLPKEREQTLAQIKIGLSFLKAIQL